MFKPKKTNNYDEPKNTKIMEVTKISFSQLFNTGNFEHQKFEVELVLGPEDNPEKAFEHAQSIVHRAFLRGKQLQIDFEREHYTKK